MDILSHIKKYQVQLALLVICILSLTLFYPSLNYYFFQDDWFVLNWARTNDLLSFFEFRTDVIYWRPISMPLFFWINRNIFALEPFGYHGVTFLFHILSALLSGYIIFLIFRSKVASILTTFFYATASFHFMSLSWLSLSWNAIGNFFTLIAIYFYLTQEKNKNIFLVISLIFFLVALASTEFALVFPLLIIFVELFRTNFSLLRALKRGMILISISSLIAIVYLFIRFLLFPIPSNEEYAIVIDGRVFNNYFWYLAWLINLPEVLKYQIQLTNLSAPKDPTFLEPFRAYSYPLLTSSFIFALALSALFINSSVIRKMKVLIATFIFIALALSPVIFLPSHSFPYYLTMASIGFLVFIGYILSNIFKKSTSKINLLLTILLIISWITASFFNLAFTRKTHWIPAEENISRQIVNKSKTKFPNVPENTILVIYPASEQDKQALMDQEAMNVIYDKTIFSFFSESTPNNLPVNGFPLNLEDE